MFYIIGLGLYVQEVAAFLVPKTVTVRGDERDVTVKGLDAIKSSSRVYLEAYTSILGASKEKMEDLYGRPIIVADRDMVESEADMLLAGADTENVSFLVVGDPFGATTHADLILRAEESSIPVTVIHNASIMNAVGATGLSLYTFGQTISIPFFTETWHPASWVDRLIENWQLGLHTLCLLDIKVKEQSEENMARGRKIFEPPRFMSSLVAVQQILQVLEEAPDKAAILDPATILAISVSQVGNPAQVILAGTLQELSEMDESRFGQPLHSLVIVGKRFHPLERDFAARYAIDKAAWLRAASELYDCTG